MAKLIYNQNQIEVYLIDTPDADPKIRFLGPWSLRCKKNVENYLNLGGNIYVMLDKRNGFQPNPFRVRNIKEELQVLGFQFGTHHFVTRFNRPFSIIVFFQNYPELKDVFMSEITKNKIVIS